MTLNQLKTRAKAHDMMIRKERNGGYWLLDIYTNSVVAPGPKVVDIRPMLKDHAAIAARQKVR